MMWIAALVGLGNCETELGHTDEAVRWFRKAIQIQPNNTHALRNYGMCLLKGGRASDAVRVLEQVVRLA